MRLELTIKHNRCPQCGTIIIGENGLQNVYREHLNLVCECGEIVGEYGEKIEQYKQQIKKQ